MKSNNKLGVNTDLNKIELTEEGLEKNKELLNKLINVDRPNVLKELVEARQQGDLSENADYDAAKNKQSEIESEILKVENIITRAKIITSNKKKTSISIGSTVKYLNLLNKKQIIIKIVGFTESDPTKDIPLVGQDSPIGNALLNKEVGNKIEIITPAKSYDIKILEIS